MIVDRFKAFDIEYVDIYYLFENSQLPHVEVGREGEGRVVVVVIRQLSYERAVR